MKNVIGFVLFYIGFTFVGKGFDLITNKELQNQLIDAMQKSGIMFTDTRKATQ